MTHYNYRSLAAETASRSKPCTALALHAYSGLQGAYAITTGTPRLLQGRIPYITQTYERDLRKVQYYLISLSREHEKSRLLRLPLTAPPSKMPPQRNALGPISGNTTRGKELTPYARGCIETAGQLGLKPHAIQGLFKSSCGAIRTTLTQATHRIKGQSLPRSGRPKVYSERDYRHLLQHIRKRPKDTY
jgi:hypothetical protein